MPGSAALKLQNLGGKVTYFGKPHKLVYDRAFQILNVFINLIYINFNIYQVQDKSRVLAVGDSLNTDIPGARNYGIDSCITMTGNHNADIGVEIDINNVTDPQIK